MTRSTLQQILTPLTADGSLQERYADENCAVYTLFQTACVGFLQEDDSPVGYLLTLAEAALITQTACDEVLRALRDNGEPHIVFDDETQQLCRCERGREMLLHRLRKDGFGGTEEVLCGEVLGLQPYMAVMTLQHRRRLRQQHHTEHGRFRKRARTAGICAAVSAVLSLVCVCTAGLRNVPAWMPFNPFIDAGFYVFLVLALALWGGSVVCGFKAGRHRELTDTLDAPQTVERLLNNWLPIRIEGQTVAINSEAFFLWMEHGKQEDAQYIVSAAMPLSQKEPVITLREDGVKTREYVLQTEDGEDFSGQYFLICVRLGVIGKPPVPVVQIDGYLSQTPEERAINADDVAYRMEGHFLACGEEVSQTYYAKTRGQDLAAKGLAFPGYTTPANVRLIGICPSCGKSFAFHSYAFHTVKSDVAYSDDGLDCCEFRMREMDKAAWSCEIGGKIFRYYNSFCCPHCGQAYIDYKAHPETKVFGVSGCVHIGHTAFCETEATNA
ncbi:MAG: hypothetical protein E7553_03625 [Ruminococcaceae bacterium]|nr:hypothetical protein [Oscillospiraceae bacterium]